MAEINSCLDDGLTKVVFLGRVKVLDDRDKALQRERCL